MLDLHYLTDEHNIWAALVNGGALHEAESGKPIIVAGFTVGRLYANLAHVTFLTVNIVLRFWSGIMLFVKIELIEGPLAELLTGEAEGHSASRAAG